MTTIVTASLAGLISLLSLTALSASEHDARSGHMASTAAPKSD